MRGLLSDKDIARIDNYEDAREKARGILPRILFEHLDNGAEDELTLRRNVEAFRELRFRPRMAESNPEPVLSTTLFGAEISMPILLAPCGGMRLVHPDGDLALARAAASAGTIQVVAAAAGYTIEEVTAVEGAKWFQLYRYGSEITERLVERAQDAGCQALAITVDTTTGGNRERERKNGYNHSAFQVNLKNAVRIGPQIAVRPGWFYRFWRDGMPSMLANTASPTGERALPLSAMTESPTVRASRSPSWEEIRIIREQWRGPLLLKGILTAEDARRAREVGANGVIVSNHGGRQLDSAPATMDALPEIVAAVGEDLTVLLDSGVRRGVDVLKALALGAKAVLVGRAAIYGLAVGGQAGIEHMLSILRTDLVRTMRLMGCRSVHDLDPSWLFDPPARP